MDDAALVIAVKYSAGTHTTPTVRGQRASSTMSAGEAARKLAHKLWGPLAAARHQENLAGAVQAWRIAPSTAALAEKPVRLEMWRGFTRVELGRFDAADDDQCALVIDASETLVKTLHNDGPAELCPTLHVLKDDGSDEVLVRWNLLDGWRDAVTGEPW